MQSVDITAPQPQSASYIANEASVAENTVRNHLERHIKLNMLLKSDGDDATRYVPDPLHTRLQTLRDPTKTHDRDGIIELKTELQTQIEDWEAQYAVLSLDAL